jgi:hypothetical protein
MTAHTGTGQRRRISDRAIWWTQTGLFAMYFALAAALLALFVVSLTWDPFYTLTLTPWGAYLVSGLALIITLLLAFSVARARREVLTACACWAGIAMAVGLWSVPLEWRTPAVVMLVLVGLVALGVSGLARTMGKAGGWTRVPASVLTILGLIVLGGVLGLSLLGILASTDTESGPSSPDGEWSVSYVDLDAGGFGGDTAVVISRGFSGLLRQSRDVFYGDWLARPTIEWVDERTILIDGARLDIYTDREIQR